MRITLLWLSLTLGCGVLISGCGQKGPLFMPGDPNPPAAPR
jgi:predicted small lipoprotein YifL